MYESLSFKVIAFLETWEQDLRLDSSLDWFGVGGGGRLGIVVYLIPCLGEDRKTRLEMCPGLSEQGRIQKAFSRKLQPCARSILSAHVLISWSINCEHYFRPRVDERWVSEGPGCAMLHCLGGETHTGLKSTETPNIAPTVTAAGDMTYLGPSKPPLIPSAITQPTKHAQELSCPSSCRFPHEDSKPQQLKFELLQKILGRKHPQMAQQAHWSACNWNRGQTHAGEGRVNGAEPGKLTEGGVLFLNPHRAKWRVVLHTHSSELKKQLEIYV